MCPETGSRLAARTLVIPSVAIAHRTALLHAGAGRLYKRHRTPLAYTETPLPQPFDIGWWAHGVRRSCLLLVSVFSCRLLRHRSLGVLFLLRIGVAWLVVAQVADIALDASRTWSLLSAALAQNVMGPSRGRRISLSTSSRRGVGVKHEIRRVLYLRRRVGGVQYVQGRMSYAV